MPSRSIDYDRHAPAYPAQRRTDPRIAARVQSALGGARTVLNVGAGAGSYEPTDRQVIAIEPSAGMRAQCPAQLVPAIDARAEALPLDDDAVDAAMAIFTVHHWEDQLAGLHELRRVASGPVVLLTLDIDVRRGFWLFTDYLPEGFTAESGCFLPLDRLVEGLGGARIEAVPIPADCSDGFVEAYYGRPEAYLDSAVRAGQSLWPGLPDGTEEKALAKLAADLASGRWDERHGHLRDCSEHDGALRLVVAQAKHR
jgi:Methyltransferase domain